MKLKIKKIKCLRCGHVWTPRKEEIRMCPKCKSPYFDKPKEKYNSGIVKEKKLSGDETIKLVKEVKKTRFGNIMEFDLKK
ncbi:MAG: hypothetical protein ACYCXB_03575 [Candidatus Humimicrobiaceae bacterium]